MKHELQLIIEALIETLRDIRADLSLEVGKQGQMIAASIMEEHLEAIKSDVETANLPSFVDMACWTPDKKATD